MLMNKRHTIELSGRSRLSKHGGVSVSTTLPDGTPADVRREIDWLVENGPEVGFMLGCSSSLAPGVPVENMKALAEGFAYYRDKRK